MVKRIVLTGGPCAGKTTVLSRIEQDLCERGYRVFIVRESATELIAGGVAPFENNVGLFNFQKLIMSYQYHKEEIYNKAAMNIEEEDIVIIYDRGLLDNKAYITDLEFEMVLDNLSLELGKKIDETDIISRYDMVIHLMTSAGNKGYSLENNKARYESEKEAILLDKKTMNSWIMHDNLYIVNSTEKFDDKVNEVLLLIHNCLGEKTVVKREKKFVVDVVLDDDLINKLDAVSMNIEQYYIDVSMNNYEYRLRKISSKMGCNYYYAIQQSDKNGVKRVLMERKISEKELNRLLGFDIISIVKKKRYVFSYDNQLCKLDVLNNGIMLLEIVFDSNRDNVVIPDCFLVLKDVTDNAQYKNINLGNGFLNGVKIRKKL